jgi:tRNA (guanine-N7-)-methyltransferase
MFALLGSFMRGRTELRAEEASVEYIPKSLTQPLNFDAVFPDRGPVEIDLGCGDGAFLTAIARANLQHNFLGIERLLGRIRTVCRKIAQADLKNARVIRLPAAVALEHLIPSESVTAFHLLFPDPWPKRRHHRRRAFTIEFLRSLHRALVPGGLLHVATDHEDYFRQIQRVTAATNNFRVSAEEYDFPTTTFEKKFLSTGLRIQRVLLRKLSPPT